MTPRVAKVWLGPSADWEVLFVVKGQKGLLPRDRISQGCHERDSLSIGGRAEGSLKDVKDAFDVSLAPPEYQISRFPGLDQYVSTDAPGPYRLTEWLVLPGQEYRVVGTCVENPESKDLSDRNLICRPSESTFVISSGAGQAAGDRHVFVAIAGEPNLAHRGAGLL